LGHLYPYPELCYKPNIGTDINPLLEGISVLDTNTHAGGDFPVSERQNQDAIFSKAFAILEQAVVARAFPGASLAVTCHGHLAALRAFGHFTYDPSSPEVTTASIYDLASVSKVVATTAMAMILYERGLLDLEMPVVSVLPEFGVRDRQRSAVTIHMLLAHSSGLPAYEKLFLRAHTREELLRQAFSVELVAAPGRQAEYSDIGFIVLGAALERIADEPLDRFCQREVFGPLGMSHTTFNPPTSWRASMPPTADDRSFRGRVIQGEVQDENASVLGGVAGHAGVFASAGNVARFAQAMLNGGTPILRADTVSLFTGRESGPEGTSRALGWDTPSKPSQSGQYFSAQSFGHLGYTGTSLWIDPARQLSVTLLTNRTWPDCDNQAIKEVRPGFHDAIIEALEKLR
jgi:CubicO group peptidase (beta-lactamase class C family)